MMMPPLPRRLLAPLGLSCVLVAGCGKGKPPAPAVEAAPTPQARAADPDRDVPPAPGTAPAAAETGPIAQAKPDLVLTAAELQAAYTQDPDYLNTKYPGKVVELTGTVESTDRPASDGVVLFKLGDGFGNVLAQKVTDKRPWERVHPGQTAVLRMRVNPFPYLWEIVEVRGPRPAERPAARLAADYQANPKDVEKQFNEKPVIVTGVIDAVKIEESNPAVLTFKTGPGAGPLTCYLISDSAESRELNSGLKAGQTVTLVGRFGSANGVVLNNCRLLLATP